MVDAKPQSANLNGQKYSCRGRFCYGAFIHACLRHLCYSFAQKSLLLGTCAAQCISSASGKISSMQSFPMIIRPKLPSHIDYSFFVVVRKVVMTLLHVFSNGTFSVQCLSWNFASCCLTSYCRYSMSSSSRESFKRCLALRLLGFDFFLPSSHDCGGAAQPANFIFFGNVLRKDDRFTIFFLRTAYKAPYLLYFVRLRQTALEPNSRLSSSEKCFYRWSWHAPISHSSEGVSLLERPLTSAHLLNSCLPPANCCW